MDPYAPARQQSAVLQTAESIRMVLPAIDLESTDTITDEVTGRGLELETVVSPRVEATMESAEFGPLMREMVDTGCSSVFVVDRPIPFYLGLVDETLVQVGLADDNGVPVALLETTDEAIRDWGEATYREYRTVARKKPVGEFE